MTVINPDEISSILKENIRNYESKAEVSNIGSVLEVGDGIARIYGLRNVMSNELVEFEDGKGTLGITLNLEENNVGVVILGDYVHIKEGMTVKTTGRIASVPVGDALIGRIINPTGIPIDGKGEIITDKTRPIERVAPGIVARKSVHQPLQTGLTAIDALTPIGRGQRELIIGDRQTGKTAIAIDTILNQKGQDVICIYVAIGQKGSSVASIVDTLRKNGAMDYTIVVSSTASELSPVQYIAPYAGCAIAEYFMYEKHKDVLIVYDDLSKHAQAYRAMSLILRRPPGREAYPGDVFYLHSRLLERAAKLDQAHGGGSITALPIIETLGGDVSAYIPTNVISITDGQIYLESELFFAGQRPAVNAGLSVSRVGGSAQTKAIKKLAGTLRLDLTQYRELASFAQFGSELDQATTKKLAQGERALEAIKQPQYKTLSMEKQVVLLYALTQGYLVDIDKKNVGRFNEELLQYVEEKYADLLKEIAEKKVLEDSIKEKLDRVIKEYLEIFSI